MIEKIDINSQEIIDFYKKSFYFSYSSLNKLLFSPKHFYQHYILGQKEDKIDAHLVEGKMLHCLLLEPEKFSDQFIIQPGKVPTGNTLDVLLKVYEHYSQLNNSELTLSDLKDPIINVLASINLHQSLKTDEQRLAKIITTENEEYFEFLKIKDTKAITDFTTKAKVEDSVEYLKDNKQVMSLLNLNGPSTYNELILQMDMQGVTFGLKGIVDNMVIDHESKTIFVNDLKTTGKPLQKFPETVDYYRYDLQAAIYYTLAKHKAKELDDKVNNYKVMFTFIVIDSFNNVYPFQVSSDTMKKWLVNLSYALNVAQYHYNNKLYGLPYELATLSVIL
jgi:hypothetical protein